MESHDDEDEDDALLVAVPDVDNVTTKAMWGSRKKTLEGSLYSMRTKNHALEAASDTTPYIRGESLEISKDEKVNQDNHEKQPRDFLQFFSSCQKSLLKILSRKVHYQEILHGKKFHFLKVIHYPQPKFIGLCFRLLPKNHKRLLSLENSGQFFNAK